MKCLILKPFELTNADNTATKWVYEGDTPDIPDDLVPGLFAEGFVTDPNNPDVRPTDDAVRGMKAALRNKDAGAAPENAADLKGAQDDPIEIPEGWADLPWPELRALAAKLSDDPIKDKDAATDAITAALAERGEAPAQD